MTRHYAPNLPEIEAYGSELNQVWTNLVDNAVDAMDGRGAIDIYADPTEDGGVQVRICDTGPGHPGRRAAAPVRAVLHHQGAGRGYRPGPAHHPQRHIPP